MAKPPAPTFRSQGNALFKTDRQDVNYRRGQEVPYDINGAPTGGGGTGVTDGNKGDITVSGGGSAWTVNPDAITYDKMQDVSAASRVLGRGSAGGAGNVEELTLGAGLTMTGTVLSSTVTGGAADGLGPDGDKGDVTVGGTGTTLTIDAKAVTLAKMADVASATVFYRKTAASGSPEVQPLATLKTDLGLSGTNSGDQTTITGNAGTATKLVTPRNISITGDLGWTVSFDGSTDVSAAGTIPNDTVTYAKMQNVAAASKLLGRGDSGAGDPQEITLGTNLTMVGTTLNAAGGAAASSFRVAAVGTGSSQNITIPAGYTADTILVFANGLAQEPVTDYTVAGTTVTGTFPASADIAIVNYGGPEGPAGDPGRAISFFFTTTPTASEVLCVYTPFVGETVILADDFAGVAALRGSLGANPAATFVMTFLRNGASVGTVSISTTGVVTAATTGTTVTLVGGTDVIEVVAPATPDTTIAGWAISLAGSH